MGLISLTVGRERPASRPRPAPGSVMSWLVVSCYLVAAFGLTWRLWADPGSRIQVGDITDVNLFAWFMRYSAESVAHGSLPAKRQDEQFATKAPSLSE